MSSESDTVDRADLRRAIKRQSERKDTAIRSEVVAVVSSTQGAPPDAVEDEIDTMEKHGFVYLVDGDDGEEVRIP